MRCTLCQTSPIDFGPQGSWNMSFISPLLQFNISWLAVQIKATMSRNRRSGYPSLDVTLAGMICPSTVCDRYDCNEAISLMCTCTLF